MARPITWQNVNAAPNVGAIEALLRSGRQAAEGFENVGEVFGKANQDIKAAATGAAVAAIANSDDPLAQQAATPTTWQFDPLAVASAANAREAQLFDKEIKGLQKNATLLEIDERQASLDDIKATRESEDLAMPYREAALAGKPFEIDQTDPRWKTAGGQRALKLIDSWQLQYREQKRLDDELRIRKNADARAANNEAERLKQQGVFNEIVRYFGNEGAAEDAAVQDRWLTDYLTSQKMGHLLSAGRELGVTTLKGNVPTEAERRAPTMFGVSAQDVAEVNTRRAQVAIQQGNIAKAQYEDALKVGEELAKNPYRDTKADDMAAWGIFQERNKDIGASIFTPKWDSDDFKQRTETIQNYAKTEYKLNLPREVAYQLVEASSSSATPWDTAFVINDAVINGIERFQTLQKAGGLAQVQQNIANIDATTKTDIDTLERETRAAFVRARFGDKAPVPKSLETAIKKDPGFRERALRTDIALLQQQLDEQTKNTGYRMSRAASLTARKLDEKVAELRSLK